MSDHIRNTIVGLQTKEGLGITFFGKPVLAMDREELKGLVCWMIDHPELIAVNRNRSEARQYDAVKAARDLVIQDEKLPVFGNTPNR